MHDDLRWNKLFGAILATGLVMMFLAVGANALFAPGKFPAKPGDAISVQVAADDSGAAPADTAPDWGTVLKTADVAAGATVSTKCQSCHNLANGGPNETGPNLWGVIGRAPGSHAGFAYSSAMSDFGKKQPVWDYDHVYAFLAGPQAYITGTKMSFVGLKKREDRINLIAWLRQQSSSPVAVPAPDPKAAAAATAPASATGSTAKPDSATNIPSKAAQGRGRLPPSASDRPPQARVAKRPQPAPPPRQPRPRATPAGRLPAGRGRRRAEGLPPSATSTIRWSRAGLTVERPSTPSGFPLPRFAGEDKGSASLVS